MKPAHTVYVIFNTNCKAITGNGKCLQQLMYGSSANRTFIHHLVASSAAMLTTLFCTTKDSAGATSFWQAKPSLCKQERMLPAENQFTKCLLLIVCTCHFYLFLASYLQHSTSISLPLIFWTSLRVYPRTPLPHSWLYWPPFANVIL